VVAAQNSPSACLMRFIVARDGTAPVPCGAHRSAYAGLGALLSDSLLDPVAEELVALST